MARSAHSPAIRFGYEDATTQLMSALGVPTAARAPFQARIRQLQRLGLLRSPEAKAYERFTYGLVELAALATACRLMSAFMLPILAVRYVGEQWAAFLPALVAGLGPVHAASRWDDSPPLSNSVIVVEGIALARIGQKAEGDGKYDGPLGQVACIDPGAPVGEMWSGALPQAIVIDAAAYMMPLINALASIETVGPDQIADEVDRLRFSGL